jgi:hypothetical protein
MYTTESLQRLQFVNENCTPSEAKDVVTKVIDDQISFYKLKNLSHWIKDNDCDQVSYYAKIDRLNNKKKELEKLIKEAQSEGLKIKLCGDFHITLEK